MGWSLAGILGAAAKAVGDTGQEWARRGIIEEEKIRSEERAMERQKELANYQDEILAAREARRDELAEKKLAKERESLAENNQIIEREAADRNIKPGTQEFFKFGAQFALDSGRPDLAKHYSDQWDKLRDDDLKREQAAAMRARGGGGGGGGGRGDDLKEAAAISKQRELDMKRIERLGTFNTLVEDPNNPGKTKVIPDDSGVDVLMSIYDKTGGSMSAVTDSAAAARREIKKNPKIDFATAAGDYFQGRVDTARTDALRNSGMVPVNDFGQSSSNAGVGNSIPSLGFLSTNTEPQFRDALPSTPAERLSAASVRRSGGGGSTGRGAGKSEPTQLYTTDKSGNKIPIPSGY
jgi:hypothetical protein